MDGTLFTGSSLRFTFYEGIYQGSCSACGLSYYLTSYRLICIHTAETQPELPYT